MQNVILYDIITANKEEFKMSKIDNFVYCLNAGTLPNDNNIVAITGIKSSFLLDFVPSNFTFSIAFTVLNIGDEEHNIKIIFEAPSGNVVAGTENIMIKAFKTNDVPDEWNGVNVTLSFANVPIKEEGVYNTKILLDDIEAGNKQIFIKKKISQDK